MKKKWIIEITKECEEQFTLDIKNGFVSQDDLRIISKWYDQIEDFGPESLVNSRFWNDHALDGNWCGFRSSSFSFQGRIIYKVFKNKITVSIVKITLDHDYKRK
ncbi:MAG: hypothetical protein KDD50_05970 [Bdellovibrionales bacterium]|nr:hypothetical protein [Bdellovibrionales bacterium]